MARSKVGRYRTQGYRSPDNISTTARKDFGYSYPSGLSLKPDTEFHRKLIQEIYNRALLAESAKESRQDAWDETDKTLKAYIDLSDKDTRRKKDDPQTPVPVVVPYSFAALETIQTYLSLAFLNQRPVFQYEAVSSEDTIQNKLMEVIVDRHVDHYKGSLALYIWMRDALAYGIGACVPTWRTDTQPVRSKQTMLVETLAGPEEQQQEVTTPKVVFEGTELQSVGPRYLLLDPNVSAHKVQNAEFIGWIEETNIQRLLSLEKGQPRVWFNAKYVHAAGNQSSVFTVTEPKNGRPSEYLSPVTLVHMCLDLIPKDWGLPGGLDNKEGEYPEKWLMTMANDHFLIRCERMESSHGKFPIAINAPDFDGYDTYPLARVEITSGLQTTLNFMFNSHVQNVRKMVNNTLIVDPSLVNVDDIKKARFGGIVRMAQSAWGKGIKDGVHQLAITDVTRGNVADAETIISLMQRILASTDNMMGVARRGGERVSATESRNVALAANSRVEKLARIISIQGMQDLAYFMAVNVQDYMSQELKLKVLGTWPQELIQEFGLNNTVVADPNKLNVPFDCIIRDGSLMVDTSGVSDLWLNLFNMIFSNPNIAGQFDPVRFVFHIARLLGAKNLGDFQVKVMPDQVAAAEAQKGNIVPVDELGA